ncbi:MAG: CHAT domain-containing protein, partial [Thermoanaerobaculia bacterium]|nr:CHAT domain-containing protein [Thermoanaerobaculia bacterium]
VLDLGGGHGPVSAAELSSLFGKGPPHLLLLQGQPGSMNGLLDFGHRFAERTGAAVLAFEGAGTGAAPDPARTAYLEIAHNQSLEQICDQLSRLPEIEGSAALITPAGGEESLLLDSSAATVLGQVRDLESEIERRLAELGKMERLARRQVAGPRGRTAKRTGGGAKRSGRKRGKPGRPAGKLAAPGPTAGVQVLERHRERLREASKALKSRKRKFSFDHERDGIEPIAEAAAAAAEASEVIGRAAAVTERVVNTRFLRGRRPVPVKRDLDCGSRYVFEVQIGARSAGSNLRSPLPLPERDLERFMSDRGLELLAVVQSRQFELLETEKPLWLPPRPRESQPVTFALRSPVRPGPAELVLLLYFRRNLLQAIRAWAQVSEPGSSGKPRGNYAETEFALHSLSDEVAEIPPRDAQLYVTVSKNPTHTLSLFETGDKAAFDLSDGKLEKALTASRERLLGLAKEFYGKRKGRKPAANELLDDLRLLAQTGVLLFQALLPVDRRDAFARKIATHKTLQIAHSKSVDQIYPWAAVYDHPLLALQPRLCPEVLAVLQKRGSTIDDLKKVRCISQGCAHRDDSDVICPSGFWGFRHTIEVPLSISRNGNGAGGQGSPLKAIAAGNSVELCMAAFKDFKEVGRHEKRLRAIQKLQVAGPLFQKLAVARTLKAGGLHILYFYCHGDRQPALSPPTVLRLGTDSRPDYVYATDTAEFVRWQKTRPIVLINGCHTLDATPDDLVSFNKSLSEGGAGAVIGTEIKVPEKLAADAGEKLIAALVGGAPLGRALWEYRLGLLLDHNPLGLVYTAYGHSDLVIQVG